MEEWSLILTSYYTAANEDYVSTGESAAFGIKRTGEVANVVYKLL